MSRKSVLAALFASVLVLLWYGCTTTEIITRRSQLSNPIETGRITVLTKDSTQYKLDNYVVAETLLIGNGTEEKGGKIDRFNGHLRLSDIRYVQASSTDIFKTLIAAGVAVFFTETAISYLGASQGLSVGETQRTYYPPIEPGSCPFVYTYDGVEYHFESETFAGAIFKGAERFSFDNLYHLKPVSGHYILKLTNGRPETQYVNEIKLLVADSPPDVRVIPDSKGKVHTISNTVLPFHCVDVNGRDKLPAVTNKDTLFWESGLSSRGLTTDEDLRDGLVLEFQKPAGIKSAKLLVNGVNTALGVFAFDQLFKLKGDNKLRWYQQLENTPSERTKMIRFMMREGMLHVKVWQNDGWVEQAALSDVGPLIAKEQIAILDVSKTPGEVLKIKLESATDLWRINQVYADYSEDLPVMVEEIAPESAVDESGNDVAPLIRSADDLYYVTIRGQFAALTFREIPGKQGMKRSYIVKSKGYYHPWTAVDGEDHPELLEKVLTEPLAGNRAFMPIWKEEKVRYGGR